MRGGWNWPTDGCRYMTDDPNTPDSAAGGRPDEPGGRAARPAGRKAAPAKAAPPRLPRLKRSARKPAKQRKVDPDAQLRPSAPIVPSQAVAGRALTLVVAIMSFLACLTIGMVTVIHDAANAWSNDLLREVTIQIRPAQGVDMLREIEKAISIAETRKGVGAVRALSDAQTRELLQPWLGTGLDLESLPVPRLIQVEIEDGARFDLTGLRVAISDGVSGASVDDHSLWTGRLASMANAVVLAGLAILALVLASMVLSVVFATRAAMAGNKDVVEVLHFVGAEDSFVAREFQRHFLLLGLKGGLAGGMSASAVFIVLGVFADGNTGFAAMEQAMVLFGGVSVGAAGYLGVLAIIFLVTVLTAATSRVAVRAHLRRID
ncbi:cell division transport system permease protein [Stappia sp. ES.058]|nr:cell division transport system permease protein [Stappia sp. ES.058]